MNNFVDDIIWIMKERYDKNISVYDDTFLTNTIRNRIQSTESGTINEYIRLLEHNRTESAVLLCSLNNTYSEFFRDSMAFALLEKWILPKLVHEKSSGGELRIWSAGCSCGQEAYSVAMILDKLNSNLKSRIRYRIFATDISDAVLMVGQKGEYEESSVKNLKVRFLQDYFVKNQETYTILPSIKDHVSFSKYDLLDNDSANPVESIFGGFDIVFCNNLMIYYKPEYQSIMLNKIIKSISDNAYFVTGETEGHFVEKIRGLHVVAYPATVFQKS